MLQLFAPAAPDPQTGKFSVVLPTGDITEFDILFAPDDDIHGALVAELQAALDKYPAGSVECHSSQYGFTDQDVADLFVQFASNSASKFLFDKTQAAGTKEAPIIADFKGKVPAAQVAVGTSNVAHQILHTKAVVLLYPDGTAWVLTGSYNLSASAAEQFNIVTILRSKSAAVLIAGRIDAMFEWVSTHEVQGAMGEAPPEIPLPTPTVKPNILTEGK